MNFESFVYGVFYTDMAVVAMGLTYVGTRFMFNQYYSACRKYRNVVSYFHDNSMALQSLNQNMREANYTLARINTSIENAGEALEDLNMTGRAIRDTCDRALTYLVIRDVVSGIYYVVQKTDLMNHLKSYVADISETFAEMYDIKWSDVWTMLSQPSMLSTFRSLAPNNMRPYIDMASLGLKAKPTSGDFGNLARTLFEQISKNETLAPSTPASPDMLNASPDMLKNLFSPDMINNILAQVLGDVSLKTESTKDPMWPYPQAQFQPTQPPQVPLAPQVPQYPPIVQPNGLQQLLQKQKVPCGAANALDEIFKSALVSQSTTNPSVSLSTAPSTNPSASVSSAQKCAPINQIGDQMNAQFATTLQSLFPKIDQLLNEAATKHGVEQKVNVRNADSDSESDNDSQSSHTS